jgi:hypothetical protein
MDCPLAKVPYATQGKAFKVLEHMRQRKSRPRGKRKKTVPDTLRPYRCQHCGAWHLGNPYVPTTSRN